MSFFVSGVIGLLAGGMIAWLVAANRSSGLAGANQELRKQVEQADNDCTALQASLNQERESRVRAETQLAQTEERLSEEKKTLEEAKNKLTDTFKALAGETLDSSNQSFLKLAKETFEKVLVEAKGELGQRQVAIEGVVKPLAEQLKQFDEHVRDLEKTRQQAYTSLDEHIKLLNQGQQQLQKETGNLVTALRRPEVRGRWGEMQLKRVVELSGMSEHCDFVEQETVNSEDGRLRPDMVINLPAGRRIVVDSKVTLDAYLSAMAAETEEKRENYLIQHTHQFLKHINQLGAKSYWNQFEGSPDFVVMFVPGESFFAAAVDRDLAMIEKAMEKRVVMATPTTLIALLRAVAFGWREEQIAKNAQEISNLGKQLYDRMRTLATHMMDMGKGLDKANKSYNKAISSMESRIMPAARRFKELGAASGEEIQTLDTLDVTPRILSIPEVLDE